MKRAFTLVELMVVIAILGALTAIFAVATSGSTESARAAKCLANLKSLATATQSYALQGGDGCYATAKSYLYIRADVSQGLQNAKTGWWCYKGWISWDDRGVSYPLQQKSEAATIGMFAQEREDRLYAVTNGALWKYVSANADVYVCPEHKKTGVNPNWSYLMNEKFATRQGFLALQGKERTLLFAEVPFRGLGSWFPEGEGGTPDTDSMLQYSTGETLGVNHKQGKHWYAHVAFADGHAEKLRVARESDTMGDSELKNLTEWLCTGKDVSIVNGVVEKIE